MSRAPSPALPDLDDTEFAAKLRPLGDAVIPKSRQTNKRISGSPDKQSSVRSDSLKHEGSKSRLSVAEHLGRIEEKRGPKRRFEYLIPVRVGDALASDAAKRGQSAATRLLEVLRDAGYPVIPEDFIDLRKEKGR
jgi:hypothetical protein